MRRQREWVTQWCEMCKGVANLFRYQDVSLAANHRYLQALSAVEDPTAAFADLHQIDRPVTRHGRRARALNPLAREDLDLIRTIARGEFLLN